MPAISFLPFLQTIPPATRLLTALLLVGSLAAFILMFVRQDSGVEPPRLSWLVLVPGESYWYPWTLLTAGWVEMTIFEAIASMVALPLSCRFLERVWGPYELVRFCFVTIVGSNIIAFGFSWLVYLVLGTQESILGPPYRGQTALQIGFLVAFTQLIPEHSLQLLGTLKIRVKNLPGIYLLVSNVFILLFGPSPFILVQFGFFVSWVYLRFFKMSETGEFRGDRSETFAFQYWFPPPIRPYVASAGNYVFKMATRLHIVQAWDEPAAYTPLPGPGGARAEAERRRALALKALDARLATTSPAPPPNAPTPPPPAVSSSSATAPPPALAADSQDTPAPKE